MPPASVLTPAAEGVLQRWPVSKRVNSSKAPKDEQSLTQSVDVEASQFPVQQLESADSFARTSAACASQVSNRRYGHSYRASILTSAVPVFGIRTLLIKVSRPQIPNTGLLR